jgi:hypothetical protein
MKVEIIAITAWVLLVAAAGAQTRTHTTTVSLPSGDHIQCFGVESTYGSSTSCVQRRTRNQTSRNHGLRTEIHIDREIEDAWQIAYRYIKRSKIRRGWKNSVRGPLGRLVITADSVVLNLDRVPRGNDYVEAAIWSLTRRRLGITAKDMEIGTTFESH